MLIFYKKRRLMIDLLEERRQLLVERMIGEGEDAVLNKGEEVIGELDDMMAGNK